MVFHAGLSAPGRDIGDQPAPDHLSHRSAERGRHIEGIRAADVPTRISLEQSAGCARDLMDCGKTRTHHRARGNLRLLGDRMASQESEDQLDRFRALVVQPRSATLCAA